MTGARGGMDRWMEGGMEGGIVWPVRHSWSAGFARPSERERTESLIRAKLRSIMTCQDLDNVTCKQVSHAPALHYNVKL